MKVIPKRTFLLRQDEEGEKKVDVIARRGVAIEVSNQEAKRFRRDLEPVEKKK